MDRRNFLKSSAALSISVCAPNLASALAAPTASIPSPSPKVKALVMGATYDEIDPRDVRTMARMMPNSTSVICEKGSHFCMWDDQTFYFEKLIQFLKSV